MDWDRTGQCGRSLAASTFVARDGFRLHCLTTPGGDLPVLLLHGFPGYSGDWGPLISVLAEDFRLIAPDMRGFNRSGAPPSPTLTIPDLLGDIAAILRALDINRFGILAHDLGAMLAWWMVLLWPKSIACAAMLSCPHPAAYAAALKDLDLTGRRDYVRTMLDDLPTMRAGWSRLVNEEDITDGLRAAMEQYQAGLADMVAERDAAVRDRFPGTTT